MYSFSVLSSGSKANSVYFESNDCKILIDCGLSGRETEKRLRRIGVNPEDLNAIVVTHEHGDHIRGVGILSRRHKIPVYSNEATSAFIDDPFGLELFQTGESFELGSIEVSPFRIAHDAVDPVGLVIQAGFARFAHATDLGKVTPLVRDALRLADALVIEFNHEPDLLHQVEYPWAVKQRIASSHGHLSNQDAAELLGEVLHVGLQVVVLAHLSENSNHPDLAYSSASRVCHDLQLSPKIVLGSPSQETELYTVAVETLRKSA